MRGPAARFLGFALAAASLAAAAPVFAAPTSSGYEDGLAAYQRNEFDKSLKLLRPLAEKGDARAQYLVGRQYQFGQAVKADRAEAFYWYKRAEAKGHMEAKLFRVLLEKRWKITASEKGRAEQKIATESAPKPPPLVAQVESRPKLKPEKPAAETAKLRESLKPSPAERAKPAPAIETARAKLPDPPKPEPTKAKPDTAKAKTPDKPALVAARTTPEETTSSVPPLPTVTRDRNETPRPAPRPAVRDDDDDDDGPVQRHNASPPPESRTTVAAVPPPPSDDHAPPHPSPNYGPSPNYAPGAPYYAPARGPYYAPAPGPYYAPAAPPNWNGSVYYGPRGYYRQAQPWGYSPYAAYMHPGWRGAAWRGPRGRW